MNLPKQSIALVLIMKRQRTTQNRSVFLLMFSSNFAQYIKPATCMFLSMLLSWTVSMALGILAAPHLPMLTVLDPGLY